MKKLGALNDHDHLGGDTLPWESRPSTTPEVHLCMISTKEQMKSQLERVAQQLEKTREAMSEMRNICSIKDELKKEFGISID